MGRRGGGYRTGASNFCAEKLWRRLAKWALAALILATIPTGTFASAAQECAASMARRDRLDHNGFKSRAKRYGLRAENVAYETLGVVHPGHEAVALLDPEYFAALKNYYSTWTISRKDAVISRSVMEFIIT